MEFAYKARMGLLKLTKYVFQDIRQFRQWQSTLFIKKIFTDLNGNNSVERNIR